MRALILLGLVSSPGWADQVVNEQPSVTEIGRFQLARLSDVTLKLDSRTGTSWVLCPPAKKGVTKVSWCKVKDRAPYPAGPVGRYRVVDGSPAMMIDTVSGRVMTRCDDPTPDKAFSWCPIDE
jgi:hypothetical protein